MKKIGLTGGIGSGKSTVSGRLAEHGAFIVDADKIAREIVEPGQPALAELDHAFDGVINPDGTLNRQELARQAFATKEKTQVLNNITHPRIRARTQELFDQAEAQGEPVVVYDMPLLIENGEAEKMDAVWVVDAPDEVRIQRLVDHRGLDEDDARRRINAQIDRETRLAAADTVLDNGGSVEELLAQVDRAWQERAQ
ncbi:dephospho-CoA kinase [Corynebacterium falsenii]|uniref:Dephospho-CoA kinase n=1 Tax=Corynebacterium falsenii TaxID=108486 RepID=A0A418Q7Y2_9CORY|nr:dephospho-CoA kinase [Corynebacterium falsenii]AHI02995.1 dephospho-CoA kinase [Corynebacterium falsenii DSM 44353]RIX35332.1 dephospho-CoA kinase [Corynebacterium falsenii]UBI03708.1 dephospho-CoA kinase [Corynebacterium falsenii]UBI06283.1 dephospho-CoA kinase [Corynebacterium falsenii]HJF11637.1 dephospho-CoA kinase [Corynebacterium falsenii]